MSAKARPPEAMAHAVASLCVVLAACASAPSVRSGPPAPAGEAPVLALTVKPGDRDKVPLPTSLPVLKLPEQQHFVLANGLKVRLVEVHKLPILSLYLVVDAGAIHDPSGAPGLASMTAAMMTEGTVRRSATRISDDLGFIGANLAAGAGFDSASLSGSVLSAHLEELLDLFADVLVNPSFPEPDFARVQDQRLVTLLEQRDQPRMLASKAFQKLYFGEHPYGHWPQGTSGSVRAMRREDLVRFHAERWRPKGSELVVVGDVRAADLKRKLDRALGSWVGAPPPSVPPLARPPAARQALLIPKPGPTPQAFIIMGMPGYVRSSADYVPAEVALQILGGGSASRFFRDLREKEGYTYGIFAHAESRKLAGASLIVGSVKTEVTGAATRGLIAEVESLRQAPVSEDELSVARNALLLSLPAEFSTTFGIAGKLGEEVVYGLPDDYWDAYAARVAKVSAEDVQRAAQQYLDLGQLITVMVCDPAVVRPQLEGLPLGAIEVQSPQGASGETALGGRAGTGRRPRSP